MTVATAIVSAIFAILFAVLLILLANVLMKSLEMYRIWSFIAWVCGVKYKGPPVRQQVRHGAALADDSLYPASHRLWIYSVRDEMSRQRKLVSQHEDPMNDEDVVEYIKPKQCEITMIVKTALRFDNQNIESLKMISVEGDNRIGTFVKNNQRLFGTSDKYIKQYDVTMKVGDVFMYDLGYDVTEEVAERAHGLGMKIWAAEDIAYVQQAIANDNKV